MEKERNVGSNSSPKKAAGSGGGNFLVGLVNEQTIGSLDDSQNDRSRSEESKSAAPATTPKPA